MARRPLAVDHLPPSADEAVAWAAGQVATGRFTQKDLCAALNARLAQLRIAPVSKSAFHRWVTTGLKEGFLPRGTAAASQHECVCPNCGAELLIHISRRTA